MTNLDELYAKAKEVFSEADKRFPFDEARDSSVANEISKDLAEAMGKGEETLQVSVEGLYRAFRALYLSGGRRGARIAMETLLGGVVAATPTPTPTPPSGFN